MKQMSEQEIELLDKIVEEILDGKEAKLYPIAFDRVTEENCLKTPELEKTEFPFSSLNAKYNEI